MIDLDSIFQEDMIEDIEIDAVLDESNEDLVMDLIEKEKAAADVPHVNIFNDTIY